MHFRDIRVILYLASYGYLSQRGCRKIIKLDDQVAPLLYIMKKFGCNPFVLGIVSDFRHTLIKLLSFLAFMLFLLPGKDDSQYVHFGFLHAVC